jgi:mono/diheme cytochrome c family protein
VAKGAELAAIGNCADCHTAPGGKSYAGSRALPTPFGTIYTSNITPDSETGIGNWSEEVFRRALRDGVDREGRHLYPAFPYDHFTHLTDDDIHALYAFIITRESVHSVPPTNKLSFPYNIRSLLAGWKLLFLQRGPRKDDGTNSAEWNRGRYLVESAAHCGACHTPRNFMGAEIKSRAFAGGVSEGWDAPALNSSSPAPRVWTADQLFTYLRTGWQAQHGGAAGPMASVSENLSAVPETDIRAIAVYIASLSNRRQDKPPPSRQADATSTAAAIYAGACIAAEELSVRFEDTNLITSDTAQTADEGFTSGSQSMSDSGTAILHAAAQVRELLTCGYKIRGRSNDVKSRGRQDRSGKWPIGRVWRPGCRRRTARSGATGIETQRSEFLFYRWSVGRARGYSGKGVR